MNNIKKKGKTSQYKGVSWSREMKKWRVQLNLKGGKTKDGGYFNKELDAGKRVNQLCQEFGLPPQNSEISAIPNLEYQVKEKTSQYKGVYWHKKKRKWRAFVYLKGQNQKYCGSFDNELDAAKKVNKLCQNFGIPLHNPGVVEMPIQVSPHDDDKNIANSVMNSEILKTDDNKLLVESHYFYDYLLK